MDNLPRNAGHGPPLEATDAVLAGLFQNLTDQQSMMPLPMELLQFVGMHKPQLADSLYHLRLTDTTSTQGLVGENVQQFMRNWTPNSTLSSSAAPHPTLTHWHPSAVPTTQSHETQTADTNLGPNGNTSATDAALPSLASMAPVPAMPSLPPILPTPGEPGRDNTPSTLAIPEIVMTPIGPEAASMSVPTDMPASIESNTPRFVAGPASSTGPESSNHQACSTQYNFSGLASSSAPAALSAPSASTASSAFSHRGPRSFHAVISDSAMYGAGAAVPHTAVQSMPAQAGFVTGGDISMSQDEEWRLVGHMPRDMYIRQPIVLPSISHFFHNIPFPCAAPTLPEPAPEPEITWDWTTIPSSFKEEDEQEADKANSNIKAEPTAESSTEGSIDVNTEANAEAVADAANAEPISITVFNKTLANGVYPEWNKIGISFQLVTGHLNHEHVESAGSGFIEVMDYIIHNSKNLGIIPQSVYVPKDSVGGGSHTNGTQVALRDLRNFWAQFYYVSRYTFTEQLLRIKATRAIMVKLEEKRKRDAVAAGELVEDDKENEAQEKKPYYRAFMGPDMWWSFGQILDENWGAYFKHFFKNQTIPDYLTPWFSQADVRFVKYTDAEVEAAAEATAKRLADLAEQAELAKQAELAAKKDQDETMEDADEKENTAPTEPPPALIPYNMISRMQDRLETLHGIMYPRLDKPSQGESDNLLPRMFFGKLLSLAHQCTAHHPWKSPDVSPVHIGLRRLSDDYRDSYMDPLEFYGHDL